MESPPLLYRLPIQVRTEIYRLCGLIRQCPIDMNFEKVRRRWIAIDRASSTTSIDPRSHRCRFQQTSNSGIPSNTLREGLQCFCPSVPIQLLLISRATHDEVESILYGENQLKAVCHQHDLMEHPLKVLWTINPGAWSLVRSLHIGLTYSSPLNCGWATHGQSQLTTVNSISIKGKQMIQRWTDVCDQLLCRIPASRLKLSLYCKVSDEGTALQVIEPLKRLQPMTKAAIWLDSDPSRKSLTRMAKQAVLELTNPKNHIHASPAPHSFWNDLPKEIRLSILSHSSLVDRFPPTGPNTPPQRDGFEISAGELIPRAEHCCLNCDSTRSRCSCSTTNAASSTGCTCPTVPVDMFLVSKLMCVESKEIFFSCNRFILNGDFKASRRWLSALPLTEARHLRTLDLEISLEQLYDMSKPHSSIAQDWEDLVACVTSVLSMETTWLSIDTGDIYMELEMLDHNNDHDYTWLNTSYTRLFDPLYQHCAAQKPRKFHVFLCWWLRYELMAEKRLMGPDYDSSREGKIPWERRQRRYPHSEQKASRHERPWPPPPY